jgi:hypothetical protein
LFVALIGVEHRSLAVEVVDSELEIAGRFGSEVAGEQGGPGSPDGLGYCAKSRERRFFLRA